MQMFHVETNALGVTRQYFSDDDGNITVNAIQDLEPLLDRNKSVANDRGRRIDSDYANPVATIPPVVALHWLQTEGWWVFDADKDPDVERKLNQKLNCSDWRHLRTSELRM
jgi:hypothetical protein